MATHRPGTRTTTRRGVEVVHIDEVFRKAKRAAEEPTAPLEKRQALANIENQRPAPTADLRKRETRAEARKKTTFCGEVPKAHEQEKVDTATAVESEEITEAKENTKIQGVPGGDGEDGHIPNIHNIDMGTHSNPQMVADYVNDIYALLKNDEFKYHPKPNYMSSVQKDITPGMRAILIDWLVEVGEEYRLVNDILYLTTNYVDRFLSKVPVQRSKLQLVGVACMLIASKYEEIYAPAVDEFVFITDNTYTHDEVVRMESRILNALNFSLTVPTSKLFLRRFLRAAECDQKTMLLASYLLELTLQEYSFIKYAPSLQAASAVALALIMNGKEPWTPTLAHYAGYAAVHLRECVKDLRTLAGRAPTHTPHAVVEKYAAPKYQAVSHIPVPDTVEGVLGGIATCHV